MPLAPANDRRKTHRQWVAMPVVIRDGGSRIDALSINLSEGGIYLFAAAKLSLGTRVEVQFRRPGSKELVCLTGAVRRRVVYLYGLEFLREQPESSELTGYDPRSQAQTS